MLREFAIDPEVLDNWKDFRLFVDQCGVEHGRLIARFPKDWQRLVYEATKDCRDVERTKIVEKLKEIKDKLARPGRPYDGTRGWLINAEAQQPDRPFHAIIARENPRSSSCVHLADEIDENTPCWKQERQRAIPRRAAAFAESTAPLFKISRELRLVDPYFTPEVDKWRRSLKALLTRAVDESPKMQRLEVHAEYRLDFRDWCSECEQELPGCVPEGYSLRVVRWQQRDAGPKMHARYILTDRGGLHVDYGLDDLRDHQTTHVTLLDNAFHKRVWNDFSEDTTIYSLADELTVHGKSRG